MDAARKIVAGRGGGRVSPLPPSAWRCAAGGGSSDPTAYNRRVRTLVSAALILLMTIAGVAQDGRRPRPAKPHPSPAAGFESVVKPFLAQHCFGCHGNKGEPEKGLNLQSFQSVASLTEHRDRWDEVVLKLRGSEMPPIEEEQPEEEQRQAVAAWIASELDRIDRTTPPDPGRVTARRLNRYDTTTRSRSCSASTCVRPTTFRRTIPATASTISETCSRCRRR